ncbi:MAG TPA: DUF192 domain-containing protein [Candidatus Paceibacterota bacterium]|uniref:DUF192 domain-containing protein n=1 Tax=Candidatus Ryanbacteria bacterium RIFCSPHIGHO2_01_FULL_45_22 TaxID=1802114 RepID=A0A1G2G0G9_9BACT|nr:MAG: hypothetical protein A2719_03945 [Candidatus Ryanbacteria bacterium RIFCSPHIGHO2_01_FULL_45_22]
MPILKRIGYFIYAIVATTLLIVGLVAFWNILVSTEVALVPASGVSTPIVIPTFSEQSKSTIIIDGHTIEVVIADSMEERAKGLGGRDSLAENEGMLFVFENEELQSFWMKGMLFSIDILWISSGGKIVDVRRNVSPSTYPESFTPRAPARYVLELPAGLSEEYDVAIGGEITM